MGNRALKFLLCVNFLLSLLILSRHVQASDNYIAYQFSSKPGDTFVELKNGLTVLVRNNPADDVLSARVVVKAGSIYEPPLSGLSHYLEHVVAGGSTKEFTEDEAKKRLERLGGATNASTSYNKTQYYITTSSKFWRDALDLLLSYVHDCAFVEKEVNREKGVILQEFSLGENSPARQLWYLFFDRAYLKHPVRYPVIGKREIFERQTRKSLMNYYHKFYQPSRMVLAVVGNVDAKKVLEFVIKKTKDWEDAPVKEPSMPDEPLPVAPRNTVKEIKFVKQPRAMIGFPSVTLFDQDMYALDVLAYILGGDQTSRLVEYVKEKLNLVTRISSFNWTPSFVRGQFIVSTVYHHGKWQDTLNAIKQTVEHLKEQGIKTDELEKVKKQVISSHLFGKETAAEQSSSLATSYLETGDPYFDDTYVNNIERVTTDDVIRVAQKYLNWNRVVIARVVPHNARKAQRSAKSEPKTISNVSLSPYIVTLPNGLKVIAKRYSRLPIVTIQLYGLGGQLVEPSDKPGISHLTASLLTAGTKKHSRSQIVGAIESVGGEIDTGSGRNTYYISIDILKDDVKQAIDVLAEILTSSIFPKREFEKEREETIIAIKRARESWQRELVLLFHKNYFKHHPYKRSILGTIDSMKSLKRADVVSFYKNMIVPNRAVVAIYGDIEPRKVVSYLKGKLKGWKKSSVFGPVSLSEELIPSADKKIVSIKNNKTAAGIFLGTAGLDIQDVRRPVLDILDAVLSGIQYPSGRLFDALRGGNHNFVYVVHAFPFYGVKAGYFGIMAQTSPEKLDAVRAIIFDKLKEISEKPLSGEELQTAKNMILTMKQISLEDIGSKASNAALNEVLGLGWNYNKKYVDLLEKVSSESVLKLAHELFRHWLIVQTIPTDFRSEPAK